MGRHKPEEEIKLDPKPEDEQQGNNPEDGDGEDGLVLDSSDNEPKDYTANGAISMIEQAKQALEGVHKDKKNADAYDEVHDLIQDAKHDMIDAAVSSGDALKEEKYSDAWREAHEARRDAEKLASAGVVVLN